MINIYFRRKAVWGQRSKAVWGPKRSLALALLLILFGVAPPADAKTPHAAKGKAVKPATPSSRVRDYKLDAELERRAKLTTGKTRVIVTLVPGATLPPEYKTYSKGNLDILN